MTNKYHMIEVTLVHWFEYKNRSNRSTLKGNYAPVKVSLTPLAKPLVVLRAKNWSKHRVDPSGLPSTLYHTDKMKYCQTVRVLRFLWNSFLGAYLVMIKAVRTQGSIPPPALTPQGVLMPGDGVLVTLLMSALMLRELNCLFSPPIFTNITVSPKCNCPSFDTERSTCTCGQTVSAASHGSLVEL